MDAIPIKVPQPDIVIYVLVLVGLAEAMGVKAAGHVDVEDLRRLVRKPTAVGSSDCLLDDRIHVAHDIVHPSTEVHV